MNPHEILQEQLDKPGKPAGYELIQALEAHGYIVVNREKQDKLYAGIDELAERLGVKL